MIASGQSPWETRTELEEICSTLLTVRSNLPAELQPTKQNAMFRATSPYFTTFVMLHAHWYQIFCDLYRFLLPGTRESVSKEAFVSTPSEYVEHCQKQCLQSAQEAVAFFETVCDLPGSNKVEDCFFGVIAYHMAQILSGKPRSNARVPEPPPQPKLRQQLHKLLLLLKRSDTHSVILKNCVSALTS